MPSGPVTTTTWGYPLTFISSIVIIISCCCFACLRTLARHTANVGTNLLLARDSASGDTAAVGKCSLSSARDNFHFCLLQKAQSFFFTFSIFQLSVPIDSSTEFSPIFSSLCSVLAVNHSHLPKLVLVEIHSSVIPPSPFPHFQWNQPLSVG